MLPLLIGKQEQRGIFPPCIVCLRIFFVTCYLIKHDISVQFFQYDPETETILAKVAVDKRVNVLDIFL